MRRRTLLLGAGGLLGAWGLADLAWVRASSADRNSPVFNVRDYGASGTDGKDDTKAFQRAFAAARNAGPDVEVLIPPGRYLVSASLVMSARMTVSAYGARILRGADCGALLKNFDTDSHAPAYTGPGGLVVRGGIWDMAGGRYTEECDAMAFSHAEDVLVQDCTILEVPSAHAVEFNGVRKGRIVNCVFDGLDATQATRADKEAIQITASTSAENLPFPPYDDTPCDDIVVSGCTLRASVSGSGPFGSLCGDHDGQPGVLHSRIHVTGNRVEAAAGSGIRASDWQSSAIEDNTIESAQQIGIQVHSLVGNPMDGIVVARNVVRRTGAGGIVVTGTDKNPVTGLTVKGNSVAAVVGQPGIRLDHAPGAVLSDNTLKGDSPGIQVDHSPGVRVSGNSGP